MDRIVKIFCAGPEQAALAKAHKTLARYPAFLLIQASEKTLAPLARKYPIEDITGQYAIRAGELVINTSRPRVDVKGRHQAHPGYRDVKPLRPGKHHYLVQFIGPIKDSWLKSLKETGAEPRQHYENFAYVVRAGDKHLPQVTALPFVRWVGHLPHSARIAQTLGRALKGRRKAAVLPRTRKLPGRYTVEFFGSDDR